MKTKPKPSQGAESRTGRRFLKELAAELELVFL